MYLIATGLLLSSIRKQDKQQLLSHYYSIYHRLTCYLFIYVFIYLRLYIIYLTPLFNILV